MLQQNKIDDHLWNDQNDKCVEQNNWKSRGICTFSAVFKFKVQWII